MTCDRSNAKTKCKDLFDWSDQIILELNAVYVFKHEILRKLHLNNIIGLIPKYENQLIKLIVFFILVINIIVLLSFNLDN